MVNDFENFSIGIDIEEIERFQDKTLEKDKKFLDKIFTESELEYCYATKTYAQHLAARFCAKEAVTKALYCVGITDVYYRDIEVRKQENGVPYVVIEKYPNLKIQISLSHSKQMACANAMILK